MSCICKCHTKNIGKKCDKCKCDIDLVCPMCKSINVVDGSDEGFYGDRFCLDCKYVDERLQFEPDDKLTSGEEGKHD